MKRILETERLYFRQFTLDDAPMVFDMHQYPEVTRYTGDPIPWDSIERTEHILRENILPQYNKHIGRWAVHLKEGDQFIGWCGLKDVDGEIDLGYRYLPQYWGKGYALEAARAVLAYGVQHQLKNIIGRAALANQASVAILQKIGLTFAEYYTQEETPSVKFVWSPSAQT